MAKEQKYDLEERTFVFAKSVRLFAFEAKNNFFVIDDLKQVVRSSGSIGANYIEVNDSISQKDKIHRVMICKKEAKETVYWLELIQTEGKELEDTRIALIKEAKELVLIFAAILRKIEK